MAALLPGQNRLWLPPPCPPETDECPNHPDLYLLRDAAADGRARSPTTAARPKLAWMRFSWMLPKMRWALCGNDAAYFLA